MQSDTTHTTTAFGAEPGPLETPDESAGVAAPPVVKKTISDLNRQRDYLGDALVKEVLNELDAGSLQNLKRISFDGVSWARQVLGDPESKWRKSPKFSHAGISQKELAALEGADDEACRLALERLDKLDKAVELPAHAEVIRSLATGNRLTLADQAMDLAFSMDKSVQRDLNIMDILGTRLTAALQRPGDAAGCILLLEKAQMFPTTLLFSAFSGTKGVDFYAAMHNARSHYTNGTTGQEDRRVRGLVQEILPKSLPENAELLDVLKPNFGNLLSHSNRAMVWSTLDFFCGGEADMIAPHLDILLSRGNEISKTLSYFQGKHDMIAPYLDMLLYHTDAKSVIFKTLDFFGGKHDMITPHLGHLLSHDEVDVVCKTLSFCEGKQDMLAPHLDMLLSHSDASVVCQTLEMFSAVANLVQPHSALVASHFEQPATKELAFSLAAKFASPSWDEHAVKMVFNECVKDNSCVQQAAKEIASRLSSTHIAPHTGWLSHFLVDRESDLDLCGLIVDSLVKLDAAAIETEVVTNVLLWLVKTSQPDVGSRMIVKLSKLDAETLRRHDNAIMEIRRSAKQPAVRDSAEQLVKICGEGPLLWGDEDDNSDSD